MLMATFRYILCLVCLLVFHAGATPPVVNPEERTSETVLFETPPAIETASIHAVTLNDAPGNVTVITRRQIRNYGYRTLAEAIENVRGFYITSDGGFSFAGVRGFGLPGDYNTRILVMVDGHIMTDNVFGAMYLFGEDFGLDMDLVERIEIMRGPSSALYGSNGVFATINIITRAPADSPRGSISTEFASFGRKKTSIASSAYLGRGVNLLVSASGFHTRGRDVDGLGPLNQSVSSVGAEQGYHTLAIVTWREWSFTANFNDRKVIVPSGWYGTDIGDTGTSSRDFRNYVEARWIRPIGERAEIRWRLYYDQFRYFGRYRSTLDGIGIDDGDNALGDWVGSRASYRWKLGKNSDLTVGSQVDMELRNLQVGAMIAPEKTQYRYTDEAGSHIGVFMQYVRNLSARWTMYGGLQLDAGPHHRPSLAPRLALIWGKSQDTSYKFIYGKSFRDPSKFEQYWEPNSLLEEEKVHTFEIVREQNLTKRLTLSTSLYHYRLDGLIEGVPIRDFVLQYQNVNSAHATGVEVELSGQLTEWLETSAALSTQRTAITSERPANSPTSLYYFRAAIPLFHDRLIVSSANRYMSSRNSPSRVRVDPVFLTDITATTRRLHRDFNLQFGVRNLANLQYVDPLSMEHVTGVLPRSGRSIFVKLLWSRGD